MMIDLPHAAMTRGEVPQLAARTFKHDVHPNMLLYLLVRGPETSHILGEEVGTSTESGIHRAIAAIASEAWGQAVESSSDRRGSLGVNNGTLEAGVGFSVAEDGDYRHCMGVCAKLVMRMRVRRTTVSDMSETPGDKLTVHNALSRGAMFRSHSSISAERS